MTQVIAMTLGANMSIAQNGKVTITAAKDGYLYMGIHDDYAADNTFVGDPPRVICFFNWCKIRK